MSQFIQPRRLRCLPALVGAMLLATFAPAGEPSDEADALARLKTAGGTEKYDADAVVVLDQTDVTVRDNGIGETRTRRLVKILREPAIRSQSVQRFDFDPTTNRLTVEAVRVYRADGKVETVESDTHAEQPAPQWGIYWGSRQRLVALPRLAVGDAVETVELKVGFNVAYLAEAPHGEFGPQDAPVPKSTIDNPKSTNNPQSAIPNPQSSAGDANNDELLPPMPGHWYDEVNFWSGLPVIEKRYTVRLPKDKLLQYDVYNGELRSSVTFDGDHTVYTFVKRDIAPFHGEAHMVSAGDVQCKLVLATLGDWLEKSRWFHQANEKAFETNDEIKAKVREVIAGCHTDEEKLAALDHWVAENIRYVGTSRGPCEGYTTHSATETFRDRGGVCKDKAGLLVAMLREAGFDSYIVMTMAGSEVWPVPADQFNHAVTCIRKQDDTFQLLDPTWMPKSRDLWSNFEMLQHVVYGTPEGQMLARSPYVPPEQNLAEWKWDSTLSDAGRLSAKGSLTAIGGPETNLRRNLAGRAPRERAIEDSLPRVAANATLGECSIMDPVDFSGPLKIQCELSADGFALGTNGRRYVPLPALRSLLGDITLSDLDGTNGLEKRKYPLRLRTTRQATFEETLHLPRGWTAETTPDPIDLDGPAASLKFTVDSSAGQLRYRCTLSVKKHRVPPEEYAQYKQVMDAFDKLNSAYVVCKLDSAAEAARAETPAQPGQSGGSR